MTDVQQDVTRTQVDSVAIIKEYYVYELYDRRDGEAFYVGEGVRDRALHHIKEGERIRRKLVADPTLEGELQSDKVARIRDILAEGEEHVGVRVIARFDSKDEARAVESVLINWVYGIDRLTNVSRGRGASYVRPSGQPFDELPGIDIGRQVRVFGTSRRNTGYLEDKIENHERFGHFGMAEDIAEHLRSEFPSTQIDDPVVWQSGRYIAVFVPLVPDTVRMIIQLTDSGLNQHVYSLLPVSEGRADVIRFAEYMRVHHPDVRLKMDGRYGRPPEWDHRRGYSNTDLSAISEEVRKAKVFFAKAPNGDADGFPGPISDSA